MSFCIWRVSARISFDLAKAPNNFIHGLLRASAGDASRSCPSMIAARSCFNGRPFVVAKALARRNVVCGISIIIFKELNSLSYRSWFPESRFLRGMCQRATITVTLDLSAGCCVDNKNYVLLRVTSSPVLDVVVACPELSRRDEVQLLIRKPVVRRQHPVDIIEDGSGRAWPKCLAGKRPLFRFFLRFAPSSVVIFDSFFALRADSSRVYSPLVLFLEC